jgi:uncharacterized protein
VRIRLDSIPEEGLRLDGEDPPDVLEVEGGIPVTIEAPLAYVLYLQVVSGQLLVSGELSTRIAMACSRCRRPVRVSLCVEDYRAALDIADSEESVDLTPDMREAMVLSFPSYPVCDSACRGLCPQCGSDLNDGDCECREPGDHRWAVLDGLSDAD